MRSNPFEAALIRSDALVKNVITVGGNDAPGEIKVRTNSTTFFTRWETKDSRVNNPCPPSCCARIESEGGLELGISIRAIERTMNCKTPADWMSAGVFVGWDQSNRN